MLNQDQFVSLILIPFVLGTVERDSPLRSYCTAMSEQEDKSPDVRIPEDEQEVIEIAGAETEQEKNVAIAQAKVIGEI